VEPVELEKTNKYLLLYFLIGSAILFLFCFSLYVYIGGARKYTPSWNKNEETEVLFHIDQIETINDRLTITGWAFLQDENIYIFNTKILLYNINTGIFYRVPTVMQFRSDVSFYYNLNVDRSGWKAIINTNRLSAPVKEFKVYILYQNDFRYVIVDTGVFLDE